MQPWTSPRPALAPQAPLAVAHETAYDAPAYYVPIPHRLAEDLRDAPAAVGAFALLARVFRATRQPVPLSPGDLQVYDPALSYGAATRALQRLTGAGWIVPQRRPGRKTTYTPSWGTVRGADCPWDLTAPCLGRPRHIIALRLDQRLLDVCVGRLNPHPIHPAQARRYLVTPLLGLRDIGTYALTLAGISVNSTALTELRLVVNGQPMPVPDEATILAIASQRADNGLSTEGWRRTPFDIAPAPKTGDSGQALFFVPPGQIGPGIGVKIADPIVVGDPPDEHIAASGQPKTVVTSDQQRSHGIMEPNVLIPTTSTPSDQLGCGGGNTDLSHRTSGIKTPPQMAPAAPTESSRLLLAAGVRRSVAASLAERPVTQVARVIAQARARADVRDVAAWVVSALRDLPPIDAPQEPERPLSALPIHTHPDLTDAQRDRWIYRFRAAPTPAAQRAILDQLAQEHPYDDRVERRL
ncbi:MAG: hypothetical protein WCI67_02255 [Chloroflexales bacterium]